jgi:hypothetical protein
MSAAYVKLTFKQPLHNSVRSPALVTAAAGAGPYRPAQSAGQAAPRGAAAAAAAIAVSVRKVSHYHDERSTREGRTWWWRLAAQAPAAEFSTRSEQVCKQSNV